MNPFFITKAKDVNIRAPHFIGIQFGWVAHISNTNKKRRQIRIGLLFWHIGVTFSA